MASTISAGTTTTTALVYSADTSGVLQLQTNGTTTAVTIDTSQNVGLGVTPSAWSGFTALQMANGVGLSGASGSSNTQLTSNAYYNGSAWTYIASAYATKYTQVSGQHQWFNAPSSTGAISFSQAMTLDSSGNLLVGTTSSLATGLTVSAASGANNTAYFKNTTNASGDQVVYIALGPNANNTSSYYLVCAQPGTRSSMYIYGNGNIVNLNNSYGAISDAKLKENVTDATPKLAQLNQVRVVNYNLIGDTTKQIGVVAQELEQVFPSMVDEAPDYEEVTTTDDEGNETIKRVATGTTTKSVKYSVFVPMLIKAIQELSAQVTTLQTQVTALQSKG